MNLSIPLALLECYEGPKWHPTQDIRLDLTAIAILTGIVLSLLLVGLIARSRRREVLLLALLSTGLLIACHVRNQVAVEQAVTCQRNVADIQAAINSFCISNGRLPQDLSELVRTGHLQSIPTCPSAGFSSYVLQDESGSCSQCRFRRTVFCRGHHHAAAGLGKDRPESNIWHIL